VWVNALQGILVTFPSNNPINPLKQPLTLQVLLRWVSAPSHPWRAFGVKALLAAVQYPRADTLELRLVGAVTQPSEHLHNRLLCTLYDAFSETHPDFYIYFWSFERKLIKGLL
jgi:hypothetical protein